MSCTSLNAEWLLVPLLALVVTLSSRHRLKRPRLAVSCAALFCTAGYVLHGCHSTGPATTSERPPSETPLPEDAAELLQRLGADPSNMRDDIHTLLAKERPAEERLDIIPVQSAAATQQTDDKSPHEQHSSVSAGTVIPHSRIPADARDDAGPAVTQCARSEPAINPRTRAAEAQRWLAAPPLAADGKNLCHQHVNQLAELVPHASPDVDKRIAGMVYLYKKGVTVSELPVAASSASNLGSTTNTLPSVTIVVPTCFHRRKYHRTVYDMMAAQDYAGKLEFLVLDGACTSESMCNSKISGHPSEPLAHAAERDERLRYVFWTDETFPAPSGVEIERTQPLPRTLGEKRNWLVQHATGDYVAHFDDDDYYAPHYISRMVSQILELDVVFIKLLSWLTFGEAFSTGGTVCPSSYKKESGRCPVVEWEEQGGFGWGWSYMYRRDWATDRLISGRLFTSKNRGEESGVIESWKTVTETGGDLLAKDADGRLIIRDAADAGGDYAAVPDDTASALRISTRSCIRATGSMPVVRCKALYDEWKAAQRDLVNNNERGKVEATANLKKALCSQLTPLGEEAEWLAEALFGQQVLAHIANFKEMQGVADADLAQWMSMKQGNRPG